ncbi:hypothetical protein [Devosia sp.]|uniref:hypothetical protein n=1 Tax=Devosia sp. TaxID=1871048 RepID=UPI001AD4A090|nr:hypothetical protein [Devosia sp.]MBN9333659.1 hypothetical protein [Devosia sp.]
MKMRFWALLGSFLVGAVTPGVAHADTLRFASEGLYIFERPAYSAFLAARVQKNDVMVVSDDCPQGYCKVWYPREQKEGYLNSPTRDWPARVNIPSQPTKGYSRITATVHLLSRPSQGARHMGRLEAGDRVKKDQCVSSYCFVTHESGFQGWVGVFAIKDDLVLERSEHFPNRSDFKIDLPVESLLRNR